MLGREYHRNYSREYYHKRIDFLIESLGGKCVECGSTTDLQFDHIDSKTKSFPISRLLSYSISQQDEEIKKCQLLCRKCHIKKTKNDYTFVNRKIVQGEAVKSSKLKEQDIKIIRKMAEDGVTYKKIAMEFGVCKHTVYLIVHKKTWAHIY